MAKKGIEYNNEKINEGLLPPQAVDIEEVVLGAMLVDKRCIDDVVTVLRDSEIFYKAAHQYIYAAIQRLVDDSTAVDLFTLSDQLKKDGKLDAVGGQYYLVTLTKKVSSSAHTEHHARVLVQQWVRRKIIDITRQQTSDAFKHSVDIFDLIGTAEKGLDQINEMLETGKSTLDFPAALEQVIKRVELLSSQEDHEIVGVTTGFKTIDKFTGGWQNSDLVIIAARPGMGKTSLILKNLLEIALNGEAVGMFSLEMSIQQIAARLVAINSEFHLSQLIKKGFEHNKYFETLNRVTGAMEKLPILIDDSAGITIQQLQMKARMWKRKNNISALFVDYIQLMSGDDKNGNREREIATISRRLKQLAKELDIPVIALSQLSRQVETRGGDKRPRLSDLRESGAIEQDADTVVFIYRPEYYSLEPEQHLIESGANTEISFAKYRAGSLATKGLWWQGDKTKFMDVEDKLDYTQVTDEDTPF